MSEGERAREAPASVLTPRPQASPKPAGLGQRCGGRGLPGSPTKGASGESVASASSFRDYCQGTIHQRRPGRSAQTARRPPGSLQIALASGEGALRLHRGAGTCGGPGLLWDAPPSQPPPWRPRAPRGAPRPVRGGAGNPTREAPGRGPEACGADRPEAERETPVKGETGASGLAWGGGR